MLLRDLKNWAKETFQQVLRTRVVAEQKIVITAAVIRGKPGPRSHRKS